jgi:radical SAM/Cys-rich protein
LQTLSLVRRGVELADPVEQRRLLEQIAVPAFSSTLARAGLAPLTAAGIAVLQVNLGKLCNQTCQHCHVDAGPDRREVMTAETMQHCLEVLRLAGIPTLDLTGGAPEMNPRFRWLVEQAAALGCRVIDRCNLTILLAPHYDDLPAFFARHRVEVVASLPCYLAENTDRQRGDGVFARSIEALRRLNAVGYGLPGSPLSLTLVFNPQGLALPPAQARLEQDYRSALRARYGIEFTRLATITNVPISRFLAELVEQGRHAEYVQRLLAAFNPATVAGLMCRSLLSVGWDGTLYDCDFNQMLDLPVAPGQPRHIRDFAESLRTRRIVTGPHCYACTAGAGSSCQGAICD